MHGICQQGGNRKRLRAFAESDIDSRRRIGGWSTDGGEEILTESEKRSEEEGFIHDDQEKVDAGVLLQENGYSPEARRGPSGQGGNEVSRKK